MHRSRTGLFQLTIAVVLVLSFAAPTAPAATKPQPTKFDVSTLQQINKYRAQRGLPAIRMSRKLFLLARRHSSGMAARQTMSHDGFAERFQQSGFSSCVENVAWNHAPPPALFNGWRTSPGHNANMLNRKVVYAGVAKVGAYATFFACG